MFPLDLIRILSLAIGVAIGAPPADTAAAPQPAVEQPAKPAETPQVAPQIAQQVAPPAAAPLATPPAVTPTEAAPAQAGQPTPAEIREELALWLRIRDTTRAEEIEAFLAAFPNGRLGALARQRLAELKAGVAPPQPQPQVQPPPQTLINPPAQPRTLIPAVPPLQPPAQPQAQPQNFPPFALNRSTISEAQERLYGLNYYSGPINGQLGTQTRQALVEYQKRLQIAATGDLNEETMSRLRAARPAARWAAMAFSARGAYGVAWGGATRRQAETEAQAHCRRNSRGQACKVISAPDTGCAALSVYSAQSNYGDRRWGAYAAARSTKDAARDAALESCRGSAVTPQKCEITALVCGDTGVQ